MKRNKNLPALQQHGNLDYSMQWIHEQELLNWVEFRQISLLPKYLLYLNELHPSKDHQI